jgi:hypothetical protein
MTSMWRGFLQASGAAVFLLGATAARAEISPSFAAGAFTPIQLAANGCGHNHYRAPDGRCDIVRDPNRDCQRGFHSVPAPTPSGYRCVQDGY